MNYQAVHDSIIDRARNRERPEGYCERHHVLMRSMGGVDDDANLVWLTGREHYIVHWLLFKIHRNKQTAFAWFRMTCGKASVGRYTSHSFVYAKRAKAKAQGDNFRGRALSEEHKRKLSNAKRGRTYADMGRDPATSRKGQKLTDEQRVRVAASVLGRRHSDAAKAKLSAAKTGALNPQFGKSPSSEVREKIAAAIRAHYRAKRRALEKQSA